MKKIMAMVLCGAFLATAAWAADKTELKDHKSKVSYTIGYNMGSSMKKDGLDLDIKIFQKALTDGLSGKKALLSEEERRKAIVELRKQLTEKRKAQMAAQANVNKAKGEAFLTDNKKKKGVKTTKSGLQYKIIKPGKGAHPKPTDMVTVQYRGKLIDGKEFDSSYKRKKPATFPVRGVIKGWQEALTLMKPGGHWEIYIPAGLAYGDRGAPPRIPPGSTLVFEVELLEVKERKAPAKKPAAAAKPKAAAPEAKKDKK